MPDDLDPQAVAAAVERFNGFYIRLPAVRTLSFTTLSVLHTLAEHGPLRLGELTATEQVSQPAITQMVTKLEVEGLVERRPDPRDRRAWRLYPTEQARAVIGDMEEIGRGLRKDATQGIDYDELAQALAVLERIKDNLQALEQGEGSGN